MAEKKYSTADQAKQRKDFAADLRAKGVDAVGIKFVHPGGQSEAIRQINHNMGETRDQSQSQTEKNHAHRDATTKENARRLEDK